MSAVTFSSPLSIFHHYEDKKYPDPIWQPTMDISMLKYKEN